jgi:pyrroloquinoline quinone (PQQ) biosynthesis protein C
MSQHTKYGGLNGHDAWLKIQSGLSINLVDVNMGEFLEERKEARDKLAKVRETAILRVYKGVGSDYALEQVLDAIDNIDEAELKDALKLKTVKGFTERLMKSYKFDTP